MISVIIPAYNASRTLGSCLEALHRQTLPPQEIIVVDDGSDDSTSSAARENGAEVLEQPHQGPAAARNLGIRQARGDLLLFTDADCIPSPTWVEEMVRPFADPKVAGVKGSYSTSQPQAVARLVQCEFEERYDLQERQPNIDLIDSYSAAFRMDVLRQFGGFAPAFAYGNEDVELSYRLDQAGCRLVFNRQAVVSHHHPAGWGAYFRCKIGRGYWRMRVYRVYPRKSLRDSYTPQVLKFQILLMYIALALVIMGAFSHPLWAVAGAALVGLWASAVPFVRRAAKRDAGLLFPAFLFITLRAMAFAIGMVGALAAMPFFHPSTSAAKKKTAGSHV